MKTEFRAELDRRGFSQTGFARFLHEHGDHRSVATILRSVANWARDKAPVPGEVRVIFRLLDQIKGVS